jgi:hypothetical protein
VQIPITLKRQISDSGGEASLESNKLAEIPIKGVNSTADKLRDKAE